MLLYWSTDRLYAIKLVELLKYINPHPASRLAVERFPFCTVPDDGDDDKEEDEEKNEQCCSPSKTCAVAFVVGT